MRPEILFPLFKPVTSLSGIGPKLGKLVEGLAGPIAVDLLWHLPNAVIDRRYSPKISDAIADRMVTMKLTVDKHTPSHNRRQPYRVRCTDISGAYMDLVFFNANDEWLQKALPIDEDRIVSGRLEYYQGIRQITHPDYILPPKEAANIPRIEPIYPLSTGLTNKTIFKATRQIIKELPDMPEWLDPAYRKKQEWPNWSDAITTLHSPENTSQLEPSREFRTRLAYDELLSNQLAIILVRNQQKRKTGRPIKGDGKLRAKTIKAIPFELTKSQKQATKEIIEDMESKFHMSRLLQGDVGSGKTIVALLAMLNAVEAGHQAAIMAPTEILARQHYDTIKPLADAAGVRHAILTGRDKGKARDALLEELATGQIDIAIGTHALFQKDVAFKDLAFVVIDEQHRFGVHQRITLSEKGEAADILVMTATPIPRTLMMTAYGDMDVSKLTEKPAGRKPIDTRVMPQEKLSLVIQAVKRATEEGAKVYWVCPLVEESEKSDLAAAEERYRDLKQYFGDDVGLVHGQMKSADKDEVMEKFANGPLKVLVATTVIEVGVNVPEASKMVIEHAERFGLAQLHQLRGRIGRGEKESTCLLLYQGPLTETAEARLGIMKETEDGFRIAEEDLRLRGSGELLGTRQSGMPEFKLADLTVHDELLAVARDDAKLILEKDPELKSKRGQALRNLLYLFEQDSAIKYLRAG